MKNPLFIYTRKKFKKLAPNKYFININTPVGDDADYYEIKPWGGQRYIHSKEIIGEESDGKLQPRWRLLSDERIKLIEDCAQNFNIEVDENCELYDSQNFKFVPWKEIKNRKDKEIMV